MQIYTLQITEIIHLLSEAIFQTVLRARGFYMGD
jgi:hypothetical protein